MNLREDLHKIQTAALAAVDAANAVRRYMRCRGETLNVRESSWDLSEARRIQLIGFGKAVVPMAEAAVEVLGSRIARGAVITKYDHATGHALPEKIAVIEAGHPVPDAAGQRGAEKIVSLLANADARDFVLVLISGGGSALLPLPVEGVPGDRRRDVGVAVAVAPGPRPEREQFRDRRRVVVGLGERVLEFGVHLVDDVEQHLVEVPLDVAGLVGDLGTAAPDLRGSPERRHGGLEFGLQPLAFPIGQAVLVEFL